MEEQLAPSICLFKLTIPPVFHDHPGIEVSLQLELFNLTEFELRYVTWHPPYRQRQSKPTLQLMLEGIDGTPAC